jgi:hypothetical protein
VQVTPHYVDINNPHANRIQDAINASRNGDTINVAPGEYKENLDIKRSITIERIDPDNTGKPVIIDGQWNNKPVIRISSDAKKVFLTGLTIQNGKVNSGGGILNSGTLTLNIELSRANFANFANRVN